MPEKQISALPIARLDYDSCKALKGAASTNPDRPTLNHVLIRDGFAEACNGHVLFRVTLVDASGEEFTAPEEIRDRRFLIHRSVLDHVTPGHSLEIDMVSGECSVIGREKEQGYPIQLPKAQRENETLKYPETDKVVPRRSKGHRELRLGANVVNQLKLFVGAGKYAGSLHILVPEEDEKQGCVVTAVQFSRIGVGAARSGVVMPMKVIDRFSKVGGDKESGTQDQQDSIAGFEPLPSDGKKNEGEGQPPSDPAQTSH